MRIVYASLSLSLSACMIIGFPKDPSESASGTSTAGPEATSTSTGTTGGSTSGGTTGGTGSTSDGTGTTEPLPTTGVPTGGTTGGPACSGLDEVACAADPGCRAIFGAPLEFPGCTPLPAFLACIEDVDCGGAETFVCRNNSLEAYLLQDTCVPPDFMVCDPMLPACGDACLALDEAGCAMDPNCSPHVGAPHVMQGDTLCADYNNLEFLTCDKLHDPCPPAVVTVCPIGQPDTAFDVASGCTPPGFEPCMDGPIAGCP